MTKLLAYILLSLFTLMVLPAHAYDKQKDIKAIKTMDKRKAEYYFLEAIRQKHKDSLNAAADNLLMCIGLDEENPSYYNELANLSIRLGNVGMGKRLIEQSVALDSKNVWTREALAELYINNKEFGEAIQAYEDLALINPKNSEYYYYIIAQLYTQLGKHDEAIKAWNKLEDVSGINGKVSVEKFKLYVYQKQESKAFKEMDKLIAAYPNDVRYECFKGDLYMATDKPKKAEKVYKKVLGKSPNNPTASTQLAIYYIRNNRPDEGWSLIHKSLNDPGIEYEDKKTMISELVQDSAVFASFDNDVFKNLIRNYPDDEFPYLIYSSYLLDKNDTTGFTYLRKALDLNPKYEDSWGLLVNYLSQRNDTIGTINACREALEQFPENPNLHHLLGTYLHIADKKDSAIVELTKAYELVKNQDPSTASNIMCGIGDIYSSQKKLTEAYAAYDSSLALNENNILTLNNYAYALAVEGKDLQKAERMSGITVQAAPQNVSFLDTYAWIYFQQGNYMLALMYIEQAFRNGGKVSAELNEHYGDILFKTGDKTKAIEFWKKALELREKSKNEDPDVVDKLRKKIEKEDYIK